MPEWSVTVSAWCWPPQLTMPLMLTVTRVPCGAVGSLIDQLPVFPEYEDAPLVWLPVLSV